MYVIILWGGKGTLWDVSRGGRNIRGRGLETGRARSLHNFLGDKVIDRLGENCGGNKKKGKDFVKGLAVEILGVEGEWKGLGGAAIKEGKKKHKGRSANSSNWGNVIKGKGRITRDGEAVCTWGIDDDRCNKAK